MSTDIDQAPEVPQTNPLAQAIAQASPEKIVSAEGAAALKELYGVYEREQQAQAKRAFAVAMSKVQRRTPDVVRQAYNDQTRSKYAKHEHVARALKPIYTREGFSLVFGEEDCSIEGWSRLGVDVYHEGGHSVHQHVDLPLDAVGIKGSRNKTDMHAKGSTLTYGRNRLTCMVFDAVLVDDDDDDGNAAAFGPPINDQQAADLAALIEEVGADTAKFCRYFQVEELGALPASRYDEAVRMLRQRAAKAKS